MKLRSRQLMAPLGFFYIENGIKLGGRGSTFESTVEAIEKHRRGNGYPPGDPASDLEQFTCQRWPQGCIDTVAKAPSVASIKFHEAAGDFIGIYGAWAKIGFTTVDQVEANRRANICWKCPANKKVEEKEKRGCCGGKWISKLLPIATSMAQVLTWPQLKNKSTPADKELYTCGVCHCVNRASVWLPLDTFTYDAATLQKFKEANPKCWKLALF